MTCAGLDEIQLRMQSKRKALSFKRLVHVQRAETLGGKASGIIESRFILKLQKKHIWILQPRCVSIRPSNTVKLHNML